ncbi:MAG TPA: AmmeMemoRadiSam system protein A [Gammaproteobacteria bacterium]|nr:AmmeMemoRadiSam system protein A [Gammaproteobacteria bacterium]
MQSTEQDLLTSTVRHDLLIQIARRSIEHGLEDSCPLQIDAAGFPPSLQEYKPCFVTLKIKAQLRGCMGDLDAKRPLVGSIAANAYAAAFKDPRFPPLIREEYPEITLHISILSPATVIDFSSEEDLLCQLRPGIDGLIIESTGHRATFLPAVWGSLPDPREFLRYLKHKAGLPEPHETIELKAWRYTAESFSE